MVRLAFAAVCAAALSHAVSASARPGDTACVISESNACPADKLELSKTDSSALVFPGGNTRCAFDDFKSAEFETNSTYFFQVFPAPATAEKKKLLLYLQGGGACTDDVTCDFSLQCVQQTFQPNARALSVGVLNRTQPENVFNDWTIVHVPYCTGDVHIGNSKRGGGPDSGVALVVNATRTDCFNQNMTVHNNGYNNAMSAFNWAAANYPEVDQLAIAGSSAGSLGAQLFSTVVGKMWKVEEKNLKYSVLADSYVGVVPDDKPASIYLNYLGTCDLPLDVPEDVVKKCKDETATVVDMMSPLIEDNNKADWMFMNSMGDGTQRLFYELFSRGALGVAFMGENDTISEENFYANMTEILDEYKDETSRLTLFFVEGDQHVFFNKDDYYNTPRVKTNETLGAALKTVLSAPVSNSSGSGDASVPSTGGAASAFTALLSVAAVAVATVMTM